MGHPTEGVQHFPIIFLAPHSSWLRIIIIDHHTNMASNTFVRDSLPCANHKSNIIMLTDSPMVE